MTPETIARRQVPITNALGLHLRPASLFVTLANQYRSKIRVTYQGRSCDGKSILDLSILGASCGEVLDLEASGPDALEALAALEALIRAEFHEDAEGQPKPPPPSEPSPDQPRGKAL